MKHINLLKEHHLKVTPQRLVIVNSLYEEGHITIDRLYTILKNNFTNISLATIYKNIHLMEVNNLIQEVKIPNHKSVYEIVKQEHSHIVCTNCSNIIDITLNTDELKQQVKLVSNFHINHSCIVFDGLCHDCVA